jgi:hypothetical protein
MIIPVFAPSTLVEYLKLRDEIEVSRPALCPECEASETFWRHGFFERQAVEGELSVKVRIQRFLCHACGLAVSCLFAFLVPYRQFTATIVAKAVEDYASEETTYRREAGELSALNSEGTPKPSHAQVFRFVDCLARKSEHLLFQLQKELVMQGNLEKLEMTGQGQCPNAYKAQSLDKAKSLNYTSELMQLAGIAFAMGNPMAELQAHFFKAVESWQAVFSVRALKLSNPQTMNHLIF